MKDPTPKTPLYVVKMRPALAAQIIGQAVARIPFDFQRPPMGQAAPAGVATAGTGPQPWDRYPAPKLGLRLILREFDGGATGRSDMVKIVAIDAHGQSGYVDRSMCWHRTHFEDEDLKVAEEMSFELRSVEGVILEAL